MGINYDEMSQEELDELVNNAMDEQASDINNGGREVQIEFLKRIDERPPSKGLRNLVHPVWDRLRKRPLDVTDLDSALEEIQVHGPGQWENDEGPSGWYAVSTKDLGIVAYFWLEKDAFGFRLDTINRWLNG